MKMPIFIRRLILIVSMCWGAGVCAENAPSWCQQFCETMHQNDWTVAESQEAYYQDADKTSVNNKRNICDHACPQLMKTSSCQDYCINILRKLNKSGDQTVNNTLYTDVTSKCQTYCALENPCQKACGVVYVQDDYACLYQGNNCYGRPDRERVIAKQSFERCNDMCQTFSSDM